MSNTYTQIYIQFVFAVFGRGNFVPQKHKEELHKYISGMVTKRNQKLLAVINYIHNQEEHHSKKKFKDGKSLEGF